MILAAWLLLLVTTSSLDTLNQTALIVTSIGSGAAVGGALAAKVRDTVTDKTLAKEDVDLGQRPRGFKTGVGAVLYDLLADETAVLVAPKDELLCSYVQANIAASFPTAHAG